MEHKTAATRLIAAASTFNIFLCHTNKTYKIFYINSTINEERFREESF